MRPLMRLALVILLVAVARVASAAPGTLTVLAAPDSELHAERTDAIRAEAAVRGLRVEILPTTGSDALAVALAQRADVVAVLWAEGTTLWGRTPDGRVAYAPLGPGESSPRVVAAIASSLIDDLAVASKPGLQVSVDVSVGDSVAPGAMAVVAPGVAPAVASRVTPVVAPSAGIEAAVAGGERPRERLWYLDVGGLASIEPTHEAYAGIGRYFGNRNRAAVLAHLAWESDEASPEATAAITFELSRTWGRTIRAEAGGRMLGLVTLYRSDCTDCMRTWETDGGGFGIGGFFGVGLPTSWGALYARGVVDILRMEGTDTRPAEMTLGGALGVELLLL